MPVDENTFARSRNHALISMNTYLRTLFKLMSVQVVIFKPFFILHFFFNGNKKGKYPGISASIISHESKCK